MKENVVIADGPVLPIFNPVLLANAIRHEMLRSAERGWNKLSLNMDLQDALLLEQFLRRHAR